MVKLLDAITDKMVKDQMTRFDSGNATKFDEAEMKFFKGLINKHPKFCKWLVDNRDKIEIVTDVTLTICVAGIAFNLGKIALAKDLDKMKTIAMAAAVDGKTFQVQSLVVTPGGVSGTIANSTTNPSDMMDIANKAIEALANNGVTFSAF